MKFSDVKTTMQLNQHELHGQNLEDQTNLSFNDLCMMEGLTPEQSEYVENFQDRFEELWDRAEESTVTPLVIENGVIPDKTLSHKCTFNKDSLRSISQSGLMATEWFGQKESASEGCFCTFIRDKKDFSSQGVAMFHNSKFRPAPNGIVLFFDNSNEFMQELLSIDFFEYEAKKQRGEDLSEYPKVIRDFYDNVVEPMSPHGKNFHIKTESEQYSWHAIPGGIPSKLVNGISIQSSIATPELLDELNNMFPNANIYNEKLELIRPALVLQQNANMGFEGPEKSE